MLIYLWDQVFGISKVDFAILAYIYELTFFLLFVWARLVCGLLRWLRIRIIILFYELDINSAHVLFDIHWFDFIRLMIFNYKSINELD